MEAIEPDEAAVISMPPLQPILRGREKEIFEMARKLPLSNDMLNLIYRKLGERDPCQTANIHTCLQLLTVDFRNLVVLMNEPSPDFKTEPENAK